MRKSKNTVLLSLICIILIGGFTLLEHGNQYFMKNFFESDTFQSEYQNFTDQLGSLVLNPLDASEAKKNIKVTDQEIEEYRNYNGSLSEQITSINDQYQDKINDAKRSKATSVEKALTSERDKKVKDITKNFEDDDYVRDKIIKIKEREIDKYVNDLENRKQSFLNNYSYFAYQLTDVSTGNTFTEGYLNDTAVYTHKYNDKHLLNISTINDDYNESNWNAKEETTALDNYEMPYDITAAIHNSTHQYKGEIRVPKT
ncbi:MAG TPA: hypothetical protein VNU45_16185, partial [Rummeliibacillus sp.]|nr:hypothetical protein [Rummeliibacillus sp.]